MSKDKVQAEVERYNAEAVSLLILPMSMIYPTATFKYFGI